MNRRVLRASSELNARVGIEAGKMLDRTVRVWDVKTGTELQQFTGHGNEVGRVAFAPDGRRALSGGGDALLRLWDVETGRQIRSFSGCQTSETMVRFSPDGRRILSASGWGVTPLHAGFHCCVRLRDVAMGKLLGCFEDHRGPVVTVAFLPDGRMALSAGQPATIT